jgi:hypothetical protein
MITTYKPTTAPNSETQLVSLFFLINKPVHSDNLPHTAVYELNRTNKQTQYLLKNPHLVGLH